jgi:hypothetical protein
MPSDEDFLPIIDLSKDAFDSYLSIGEARALHEFLSNMTPRHAALFCSTATEALLAVSAVQKLSDWLLTRALNNLQERAAQRAFEPPDDE